LLHRGGSEKYVRHLSAALNFPFPGRITSGWHSLFPLQRYRRKTKKAELRWLQGEEIFDDSEKRIRLAGESSGTVHAYRGGRVPEKPAATVKVEILDSPDWSDRRSMCQKSETPEPSPEKRRLDAQSLVLHEGKVLRGIPGKKEKGGPDVNPRAKPLPQKSVVNEREKKPPHRSACTSH